MRAYDALGTCFSFFPAQEIGWRYAIDVELQVPAPEFIQPVLGSDGLARWVEIEVVAKLTDTPAHIIFQRRLRESLQCILDDHGIEIRHCDTSSHWIAVGRCRT